MSKVLEVIFSKQNKINQLSTAYKASGYLLGLKYVTDKTEKLYILSIVKQQNELNFVGGLSVLGIFHPADSPINTTAGLVTCTYADKLAFTRAGSDETVAHTSIDRQDLFKQLAQYFTLIRLNIATEHSPNIFNNTNKSIYTLFKYDTQQVLNTEQTKSLSDLLTSLDNTNNKSNKNKSTINPLARHEPVELSVLTNKTSAGPFTAPSVSCHPTRDDTRSCHVSYDLLCYLPLEIDIAHAFQHIADALTRQHEHVVKEFESRGPVKSYHYHVTGVDHYVTALYQPWQSEELQVKQRVKYHAQYLIDTNRPMFRINSAVTWHAVPTHSRLTDVHLNVPLPKDMPADSTLHVIDGSYEYYHYRQEQFNDEGWGCAYRSLQTLFSWLQHQHYMSRAVPAIPDIQRALVELNDKPRGFINSREWIGAFEVSLVLDHWAQLPSKLINLTSGADLARPDIVRDLAAHFDRHGAPVMIGGGVLAYTLLGVMRHPASGSVRFLILDPHYTGAEQIQSIVSGRWCAWHAVDLFRADCFYNLCLPQRPNCYT